MKTLQCDLCDYKARGETFNEWMIALKPHYAEAHAEVMSASSSMSKEEQMQQMQQWMQENQKRFDSA